MTLPGWKKVIAETGALSAFAGRFFAQFWRPRYEFREFFRQCFYVGYQTLGLVAMTAFIIGLVITIQSRPTLVRFGAEAWLPGMVSVSLVREIVPVITALICAGKIGSSIGAELGSMRVTEQIDAMEVSGTNPFKFLVVTRILATTLTIPILAMIADGVSLYGSYLGCNLHATVSWDLFWYHVFNSVWITDFAPAFIKTYFFGFAIGLVGCYKGYFTTHGTEGVGRSANSSVVLSSMLIFIIDLVAVQITDLMGLN